MTCKEIKKGMLFDSMWMGKGHTFYIVEEGTFYYENGKRMKINNTCKNKWWAFQNEYPNGLFLFCFSEPWDNRKLFHFRWPNKVEKNKP